MLAQHCTRAPPTASYTRLWKGLDQQGASPAHNMANDPPPLPPPELPGQLTDCEQSSPHDIEQRTLEEDGNTLLPTADESSDVQRDPIVGVDLGTTYSCVAVWENGRPVVVANNVGNRTTPSWVCFHGTDVLVGEAARSKGLRFPRSAVYDAKRMIGRKLESPNIQDCVRSWPFKVTQYRNSCAIDVGEEGLPTVLLPEEVSAYVLVKMKQTAEDYLGCPVHRAVVTVPAYFNDAQRQATIDACTIAGLKVERIINEPTAAALAYGLEKGVGEGEGQPRTLLVYDLGGGTLDVTVMMVDNGVFEVLSTCGDTQLGGQDFDSNLVDHFLKEIQERFGCANVSENKRLLRKLRDHCQQLKHNLSHSSSAVIEVDSLVDGEDFESSLTREAFAEINHSLLERCLQPIDRALSDAGVTREGVDEVVLIGGSTRITRVQQLLEGYFSGVVISKKINPDEAVAMGAAIQGANLSTPVHEKNDKLKRLTLMDVTPLSLGIELVGGKMSVIVPRNTTVPYSRTRTYRNNEDNQTQATIEVFEGEDPATANNRLLGKFTLKGFPPRPRGEVEVDVMFSVDVNAVLEVTAQVKGQEAVEKMRIEKEKGLLNKEEVQERARRVQEWERRCREQKLN